MNILQQALDDRTDPVALKQRREDAAKSADVWQLRKERPEVRLLAFDRWVRLELETRLDWAWAGAQRERRIEQCRIQLERIVLDLWRRGWMLDGKALAARIVGVLDTIGAYQRAGKVADFWPYFVASVNRYVGANAEEIQDQARSIGAQMGGLMAHRRPHAARAGRATGRRDHQGEGRDPPHQTRPPAGKERCRCGTGLAPVSPLQRLCTASATARICGQTIDQLAENAGFVVIPLSAG